MDMQSIQVFLSTTATELAIKILAAIAFWIAGRWLIGRVIGIMQAAMNRNHVDPTLTKYLGSIIAIALNIALVLGILGYFGFQTTPFAAMLVEQPSAAGRDLACFRIFATAGAPIPRRSRSGSNSTTNIARRCSTWNACARSTNRHRTRRIARPVACGRRPSRHENRN